MSLVVGEGISKSWSEKDVLKNVAFTLAPGERVGLVGPNGQGKTTLIRIIAGLEQATTGTFQRKGDLRIGYLPQDPPAMEGATLRSAMLDVFGNLHRIEQELHDLAGQMAVAGQTPEEHEKILARYGQLQHEFEDGGGYTYSHRIDAVLCGLEFDRAQWDRPLAELSGGQRTRAYLARLLLEAPDVLLLDEPTNHLDLAAVEWLEQWVRDFPGAMIVVSHDRYFLDRVTEATWEVSFATLECYKGNYSRYLAQRDERYKERMRRWEAQREFIETTEEFIRRFLAGQRSKEAQGRRTRLARFIRDEAIPKPREHERISVRLKTTERTGDFVLYLTGLKAGYPPLPPLVSVENLSIQRGQRVAIVGPNGCGKTTLLRTMLGQLPPMGGKVRLGSNVRLGYLSQTHSELDEEITALDAVRRIEPTMSEERGRNLLGSLLLSGDDAFKKIKELSGGQRSRVVLARLMLQKANVLVMDEPTNHLDVASQEVLQDVLGDFDGTVIFVSHDRYLIQALATHVWAVWEGAVVPLTGSWGQYVKWRDEKTGAAEAAAAEAQADKAKVQRKEDYRQRRQKTNEVQRLTRRLAQAEKEIHDLEARMKQINQELTAASDAGDVDKITALGLEYTQTDDRLRKMFAEWEEVSTGLEKAGAE